MYKIYPQLYLSTYLYLENTMVMKIRLNKANLLNRSE